MVSRQHLEEMTEAFTYARNKVSDIGYNLENWSTVANSTSPLFARCSSSIISEINDLYVHINGALNQLGGIKPEG